MAKPDEYPLLSSTNENLEQLEMWQDQFMKGVYHGLQPNEKRFLFKLIIRVAKILTDAQLGKVEGINDAHQFGYDLVCAVRKQTGM